LISEPRQLRCMRSPFRVDGSECLPQANNGLIGRHAQLAQRRSITLFKPQSYNAVTRRLCLSTERTRSLGDIAADIAERICGYQSSIENRHVGWCLSSS